MRPTHLIPDDVLMRYAAGSAGEAVSLLAACHLTLSPDSRERLGELEAVGGELFAGLTTADLAPGSLEAVLARLDEPAQKPAPPPPGDRTFPAPLRRVMARAGKWKTVWPGVQVLALPVRFGSQPVRMVRFAPGTEVPQHTHGGDELNLVLQGGFTDRGGEYLRGDIAVADDTVEHDLVVHDDDVDCIVLSLLDNPLVPRSLKGTIAHWITGI